MSAAMTKRPAYLDSQAVAKRLGVKVRTVYDYRSSGRLPVPDAWFGGSPAWLPGTIEAYVAGLAPWARAHRKGGES
jgi:predicted DNA-binding transcriptional regulator AlpA